jgi:hypothetical protein
MEAYKLTLNEDCNVSMKFYTNSPEDAHKEALGVLGWTLLNETDSNSDDQMKFNFFDNL